MSNLPKHHVYSLVASELERAFKYVYDVEPDKVLCWYIRNINEWTGGRVVIKKDWT